MPADPVADLVAARRFLHANARLLDVHRAAVAFDGASRDPVLRALGAYRNDDGGFGHGLEPDVRGPVSETTSTLYALEVLESVDAFGDPMVAAAAHWAQTVSDGGEVPFLRPGSLEFPHAPWMQVLPGGCHLGFGFAALLSAADARTPFRDATIAWSWAQLEGPGEIDAYSLKYALMFLDRMPDDERRRAALDRLRPLPRADGSVPVPGGQEGEHLTALVLSPTPGAPSRALFSAEQIDSCLDELAAAQRKDGGWTVDFAAWCPAQGVEWRGLATLQALLVLRAHGRV